MRPSFPPSGRAASGRGRVRPLVLLLPLLSLPWSPPPLSGQEVAEDSLQRGDRVRVWRSESGWEGREFDFREWEGDSLVLMEPDTFGVSRLSSTDIEELQLRRETGGTHLLEGALIGGGVGVLPIAVLSARECSGPDYRGGVGCTIGFMMEGPVLLGVVPGALLGGVVGLLIPEREWISIEPGPPVRASGPGRAPARGGSVRVRLRIPPIP